MVHQPGSCLAADVHLKSRCGNASSDVACTCVEALLAAARCAIGGAAAVRRSSSSSSSIERFLAGARSVLRRGEQARRLSHRQGKCGEGEARDEDDVTLWVCVCPCIWPPPRTPGFADHSGPNEGTCYGHAAYEEIAGRAGYADKQDNRCCRGGAKFSENMAGCDQLFNINHMSRYAAKQHGWEPWRRGVGVDLLWLLVED